MLKSPAPIVVVGGGFVGLALGQAGVSSYI